VSHASLIMAADLFIAPTLTWRLLFALLAGVELGDKPAEDCNIDRLDQDVSKPIGSAEPVFAINLNGL
jgi:hypothetical protein